VKSFCDVARWRELEGWSGMSGAVVRLMRLNRGAIGAVEQRYGRLKIEGRDGTQEGDGWGDIGRCFE